MNRCKLCVVPVLNAKDRRRLPSPSSEYCREALTGLAIEFSTAKMDASQEYGSVAKNFNSLLLRILRYARQWQA